MATVDKGELSQPDPNSFKGLSAADILSMDMFVRRWLLMEMVSILISYDFKGSKQIILVSNRLFKKIIYYNWPIFMRLFTIIIQFEPSLLLKVALNSLQMYSKYKTMKLNNRM